MGDGFSRRQMLRGVAGVLVVAAGKVRAEESTQTILDAHVHAWDLNQFRLPWLDHDVRLRRDYSLADYLRAAEGLNIRRAVYVEVNVEPKQRAEEAIYVADLCARPEALFAGGVIAADPRDPELGRFLDRYASNKAIKGVRFLYPAEGSTDPAFLRGLQVLGTRELTFDLQLGPDHLPDAEKAVAACRETRFILDHCGGAEARQFRKATDNEPDSRKHRQAWHRGIEAIAKQPNVWCKISGVADGALPGDDTAPDVAPIVTFCLDHFGPDRVMFGGNWPVCLKGTSLRHWVQALDQITAGRPESERRRLFHDNAKKAYRLG